ncbi:MAG TPA: hypothetical protein PK708_14215 [Candidatus Competibacter sp.]|nr:hypothetical protein [Candidatus Competibacter sp.]
MMNCLAYRPFQKQPEPVLALAELETPTTSHALRAEEFNKLTGQNQRIELAGK